MSVKDIISQSFPVSLVLGLGALTFAIGIGVPIGIISAVRRNSWVDWSLMAVAMVGICVPAFTVGPLLQILVAANIPGLKVAGGGVLLIFCFPHSLLGWSQRPIWLVSLVEAYWKSSLRILSAPLIPKVFLQHESF